VIPFISICLAAFEAYALLTKKPTVTDYSRRWPEGIFVWSWLAVLALHFLDRDS
jgi:hypothetical protein